MEYVLSSVHISSVIYTCLGSSALSVLTSLGCTSFCVGFASSSVLRSPKSDFLMTLGQFLVLEFLARPSFFYRHLLASLQPSKGDSDMPIVVTDGLVKMLCKGRWKPPITWDYLGSVCPAARGFWWVLGFAGFCGKWASEVCL